MIFRKNAIPKTGRICIFIKGIWPSGIFRQHIDEKCQILKISATSSIYLKYYLTRKTNVFRGYFFNIFTNFRKECGSEIIIFLQSVTTSNDVANDNINLSKLYSWKFNLYNFKVGTGWQPWIQRIAVYPLISQIWLITKHFIDQSKIEVNNQLYFAQNIL